MSSGKREIVAGSSIDNMKELVREKLIKVFENDPEPLVRILFYLDEEDRQYSLAPDQISPAWRTLILLLKSNSDEAFRRYANRMAEDVKRADRDPHFRKKMAEMYAAFLPPSDTKGDVKAVVDYSKALQLQSPATRTGFLGLAHVWNSIPPRTQNLIIGFTRSVATRYPVLAAVDDVVGLVSRHGGSVVMVALAVAQVSYEVYVNIRRWLNGEISGKRCCKNIVDAFVTVGAGVAGGIAGASVGSLVGPVGTFVGAVVGSVASAKAAEIMSDYLTQKIFGLPREEALENAYRYFGLGMNPSTNEINTAYRRLCLKYHPDKGGSDAEFQALQHQLVIIREKRK